MSTSYSATDVPVVPFLPSGHTPAFGGPTIGGPTNGFIGTGGNDDEIFREIVRSLVDAAPPAPPFLEFTQLASIDPMYPVRTRAKKPRVTAFAVLSVLICGLFGGIGAWSISYRVQKSETTAYRFASLPKGAYLLEATRTTGGAAIAAQTQQLWKDTQGRYTLVTVSSPNSDDFYLHRVWSVGGLDRNIQLSLLGTPNQEVFVGKPSPLLPSEKVRSDKILAAWNQPGVIIEVERGTTVFNNPNAYAYIERDGKLPSREERVQQGNEDLAVSGDFQEVLEKLRLVDTKNPMLGMVLPKGFSSVDEVVNPAPMFRSAERTDMWVKLKSGEVIRAAIYKSPRRTLTLPKAALEPQTTLYPVLPTGVSFTGKDGEQIDMEAQADQFSETSSRRYDRLLNDLRRRLVPTEVRAWRSWADELIRRDLDVFERKVWKGMPIFLAWRKSAANTTSTAISVCLGSISSTSCTMLGGDVVAGAPFVTRRSVLLADGRWVVLDNVRTMRPNQSTRPSEPIAEHLPFDSVFLNAEIVPKDLKTYRSAYGLFESPLFRPLR
jgi:hypothetical protein